jgi:hypothetical protein
MAPNYEKQIEVLVKQYKRAVEQIKAELERLDISTLSRANSLAALKAVSEILSALNEESTKWVDENIPLAVRNGIAETMVALGVAETVDEAMKIAKFNRVNSELVKAVVADTQADLLAVTQNVDKRVRASVRQVTAEVMRDNLSKGINGRKTMNRQTLEKLRGKLGDSVNTGIIDASGRRWKPEVYVDMVTRTKLMKATNDATINEAIGRDAYYGVISSHGAKDACRNWEGKIVKLVSDAPGDYPYIGNLPNREIFHPNCLHTISPTRIPDRE